MDCITDKIPGVFVECGVGAGGQIGAIQMANTEKRIIYAFDSFEGIPLCGINDDSQPGIGKPIHDTSLPIIDRLVSSGITSCSIIEVRKNIKMVHLPVENIRFIKGWFQNTLPVTDIGKIALLRLDGDLYESTEVCLKYLYPKVVNGGYVIIDDYGLDGGRKAVNEYLGSFCYNKIPPEANGAVWFKKKL